MGPSDLYKLVKEIGKFVQNVRTFTAEATSTIETNLESQLQLEEIRKAQRELNEAFSFRRSINVEADSDPFEVNAKSPRMPEQTELVGTAATATATAAVSSAASMTEEDVAEAAAAPKKKIRRRRIKKKVEVSDTASNTGENPDDDDNDSFFVPNSDSSKTTVTNNIPDLSLDEYDFMTDSEESAARALKEANEQLRKEAMEEEAAQRRLERLDRLSASSKEEDTETADAAEARFQAQLSGNWNDQILSKGEELSPLANIMERLALLEEEKQAADQRLQEEFRLREENEERFYREKRKLLEEAAAQVQADVYFNPTGNNGATTSKTATESTTITKA